MDLGVFAARGRIIIRHVRLNGVCHQRNQKEAETEENKKYGKKFFHINL